MSIRKMTCNDSVLQKNDITNDDLAQFVETYLKALLLYNTHPINLLLPNVGPDQEDNLQNLYALLNQITSDDANALRHLKQQDNGSKITKQALFQTICEQQKIPQLDQESESNSKDNLMKTISNLVIEDEEEINLQQMEQKGYLCWGP